jgi:membrane protein DedA with SNARE-associated domain
MDLYLQLTQLLENLKDWLHLLLGTDWAYLVLFVWTIFEGETCLILAGAFAAHSTHGTPNIFMCILSAFGGSLAGDQMWFFIGRTKGNSTLFRRPSWREKAQKVFAILEKHNTLLILGFRFLYGLRTVTPFAIGMSAVKTKRFIFLNVIGAAVWAAAFGLAGYVFGTGIVRLIDDRKHHRWVILFAALAVFLIWLIRGIFRTVKLRKARRLAGGSPPLKPLPQDEPPAM